MSGRARVALSEAEGACVRAGRWVRVSLGRTIELPTGRADSALVGMTSSPGRGGSRLRAWANACLHQPTPLDATRDPEDIVPGVRSAPMDDERVHLVCHSHGAVYRTRDGYCLSGPCVEQSLAALDVRDEAGTLVLELPDGEH